MKTLFELEQEKAELRERLASSESDTETNRIIDLIENMNERIIDLTKE